MTDEVTQEVDETLGQIENPVEVTPEETLPISEQQPSEDSGELPEAVAERTKAEFEKLKSANRRLKDELDAKSKQYGNSVFDGIYGQTPSAQAAPQPAPFFQGQGKVQSFVDENGYVDTEALSKSLAETAARAQRAEQQALWTRQEQRRAEEERQAMEAHREFPQIDPKSDQFDPRAYKLVKNAVFASLMEGNERPVLVEIAKDTLSSYKAPTDDTAVKEQAVAEYKEKQAIKAQASAVQAGKGQPREERGNLEELRERTLHGDSTALDERLANII